MKRIWAAGTVTEPTLFKDYDGVEVIDERPGGYKRGLANGVYYSEMFAASGASVYHQGRFSNEIIEVTARVAEGASGGCIVNLHNDEHKHGASIKIFGDGRMAIGPNVFDPEKHDPGKSSGLKLDEIAHSAVKPAGEWNTVRLVVNENTLQVHVNGEQVCEPIRAEFSFSPGTVGVGLAGTTKSVKARVEYAGLALWPTTDLHSIPEESTFSQKADTKPFPTQETPGKPTERKPPVGANPEGKPPQAQPPVAGKSTPGVQLFDQVMQHYLERIGCSTAALAISNKGNVIVSRGYGWSDREKTVPTHPNTMIGIANCDGSLVLAVIKHLARRQVINLDAPLFNSLGVQPRGDVVDPRMGQITVRHVLDHKAGWGDDPAWDARIKARAAGLAEPYSAELLLGFIATQRLKNAPGQKAESCSFDYDALRHIASKATGRPYVDYVQRELFKPMAVNEIQASDGTSHKKTDPPLVWNAQAGGPVAASAPALCFFMRRYWLDGDPRDTGNQRWAWYGGLPGSTSMMIWWPDGIDIAVLFNGRANVAHAEIRQALENVIVRVKH